MKHLAVLCAIAGVLHGISMPVAAADGNRLTILDESCDIYYPDQRYPKLTTPQWVGEDGVGLALVLAIDDMREHVRYENYLRPILKRLKGIDGRAPVSIMSCSIKADEPHLQTWLKEGVSLETHTVDHPCPILDKGNFAAAKSTYDRCVDHFFTVPNNHPVAFRTPCMDGINSASPRLFAEIMMSTTPKGNFLAMSSSIGLVLTADDPELPKELVLDPAGRPRFPKYLLPGYINYINNYPYPYVIGNLFWELPFCVPDDYEGSRVGGDRSPQTVEDMKAAIDAVAAKKGVWVMTFHPYQWLTNTQAIELIDHTVAKHGKKAKFMTFRDVNERMVKHLLGGQALRRKDGGDNGVRLLDLNKDGYLDVVIGNDELQQTRVWNAKAGTWKTTAFPVKLVNKGVAAQARFGVLQASGFASVFASSGDQRGLWHFDGENWTSSKEFIAGLEEVRTEKDGKDRGVRFRDVDGDGICELFVSNPEQNMVYEWSGGEKRWKRFSYALPKNVSIVNAEGKDNGVRFVDFNKDRRDDVILSNQERYGLWLYVPEVFLGFKEGWSREITQGKRGEKPEIPMIVRGGEFPNNGAWFGREHMWVQNEDTGKLPDLVERVSYAQLLNGFQPAPKEPQEALKTIQAAPEYTVELVAHEPAVQDPVAFDWGADGTLWVVEMGDYPNGVNGKPGGRVKQLSDADGDGLHETATVFMEPINFPNGIMPWRNGALISAAPDIIYAEDSNGDGRADVRKVLFTGFAEGNQQHRMNGFELGLDNWIYGANGDSGGEITSTRTGKKVRINGRDFRFKPDTGEFETASGQTQYGRHRDAWGNWFGGANYTWGWHYYLQEHYLARNPQLAVKSTYRPFANYSSAGTVFPVSRLQQRFNDIGMAGHVTSGNSVTPYRDDLFGPEFERSILISEPVHNLIHREVLEVDGVTFKSGRANGERNREFLASTDPWFRPIMIKTGPDGAVYFADMYRLVIEHPEWIPEDVQQRIDLRAGADRGRLYRIRPKEKTLRPIPQLNKLTGAALAEAMDSANGWQRDTVHRLLLERQDKAAVPTLEKFARENANPKVRLQSLCILDGLGSLGIETVLPALEDSNPSVREHAVRLSEGFLRRGVAESHLDVILAKTLDIDVRVRFQLAFSLGESAHPKAAETLAKLALAGADNEAMITAVLSSAGKQPQRILEDVLSGQIEGRQLERLVQSLVSQLVGQKHGSGIDMLVQGLLQGADLSKTPAWRLRVLTSVLEGSAKQKLDLQKWNPLFEQARELARADDASADIRQRAVGFLGRDPQTLALDLGALSALLNPKHPAELQEAALARITQVQDPAVPRALLKAFEEAAPSTRNAILAALLRREQWTQSLLGELERSALRSQSIPPAVRQELLVHSSGKIRERAEKIFSATSPPAGERDELVRRFSGQAQQLESRPERGRALFDLQCAACHRAGATGAGAGPDLAMLYNNSIEQIVTAILDPNRAVEEKYRSYTAETKDGEQYTGILLNQTANSIRLMGLTGADQSILRRNLASLTRNERSMMPEGFEQQLNPQDLADLVAFIRSSAKTPAND